MTWLDRLKAYSQSGSGLPRHRQNRQNPGFVSFDSPAEAQVLSGELDQEGAREAFEERAAIMEFDGGLSRAEAERAAGLIRPDPEPVRWRGAGLDLGDLRPCLWCRNLSPGGRCLAAWRGELRAARDYSPTFPDLPQRCIGYRPNADDPDRTPGRERWPDLVAWQAGINNAEILQG